MSKWNKPAQQISQDFRQNEERRKQMIIEAARRRKEQEKKLKEQEAAKQEYQQKMLTQYKQAKKQGYSKLTQNNMHDKYQQLKQDEKIHAEEVQHAKWKKKSHSQEHNRNQDNKFDKQSGNKESTEVNESKSKKVLAMLRSEFEKEWQDVKADGLKASTLLDSLDLDFNTLQRQEERLEMEDDQSSAKNIRDLIGYESILIEKHQPLRYQPIQSKLPKREHRNEAEILNQLKNNKLQIMHWAIQEQTEADQLFSNCTSKKNIKPPHPKTNHKFNSSLNQFCNQPKDQKIKILQKQNVESSMQKVESSMQKDESSIQMKKKGLNANESEKIFEKKLLVEPKQQHEKNGQRDKRNDQPSIRKLDGGKLTRQEKSHSRSKDKKATSQDNQINSKINKVRDKESASSKAPPKVCIPIPISISKPNPTEVTHQHHFEIDSFIKDQLLHLNGEEQRIQNQLKNFHQTHKQAIKNVENKFEIRTDFKHSAQLAGKPCSGVAYVQGEDQLEESLQRLDDMLIRNKIDQAINEPDETDTIRESIINPMSDPFHLQRQILELARNISKYESYTQPEAPGYSKKHQDKKIEKPKDKQTIEANLSGDVEESINSIAANEKIKVNERLKQLLFQE